MDKKYTLQRSGWSSNYGWEDEEKTHTMEEAKQIYENHYARYEYAWRVLEEHTLGQA